ncbi:GNAT family N-acetyltransferase [Lacticigenium naphthae]|uniref:GNAT family N-acetyltransferase n=1 Tax=Lacticigenium naphthae TaxID=515351 RepID=UPI000428243D|nr:GNAT family N-acetyltransferase [Lacticigenium naphthae]
MEFEWTKDISSDIFKESCEIREAVFIQEQKVPREIELDRKDDIAMHVVGYIDNVPVATARVTHMDNFFKIQRVALKKEYRNKGFGYLLLQEIENKALELSVPLLVLNAQEQVVSFYKKNDYEVTSHPFSEANIIHLEMKKRL